MKNRILLFDTITDGHHPDYLIHLIGFYSGNQEVELFVATGESFKSQFDARQKDENNQWGNNVTFLGIPTNKLNSIHSKPIYLRSIIEWNLLVETAKEINEGLEAYVIVNMASPNPNVKEVEDMKELVKEFTYLTMLRSVVYERIVYRRAAVEGMGVVEYKPEDPKAIQEIVNLYEEIYGQIDNE